MPTVTMMITVTRDQWLELHGRTLDCVHAAIADLSDEAFLWEPVTTRGEETGNPACLEPRPFCIGEIVTHLCDVEAHWLGKVDVHDRFAGPRQSYWNQKTFDNVLDITQREYRKVFDERPKDRHVLFGLGRVCQHNLYHVAQLIHLRRLQEPEWQPPPAGEPGSWEHAVDFITDLLIFGDKAPQHASQS